MPRLAKDIYKIGEIEKLSKFADIMFNMYQNFLMEHIDYDKYDFYGGIDRICKPSSEKDAEEGLEIIKNFGKFLASKDIENNKPNLQVLMDFIEDEDEKKKFPELMSFFNEYLELGIDFNKIIPDYTKGIDIEGQKSDIANLFEEYNKEKAKEEEKEEKLKDNYIKKDKKYIEFTKNPTELLKEVYGPYGKIREGMNYENAKNYDDIILPVPKDLDEDIVTAVMLGAFMSDPEFKTKLTGSSPSGSLLLFNWNNAVDRVATEKGDSRMEPWGDVMVKARQNAKIALKNYEKGNTLAVKNYLQTFLTASAVISPGLDVSHANTMSSAQHLAKSLLEKKQFDIQPKPEDYNMTNIFTLRQKSIFRLMEAEKNARENKIKLINEGDKLSTAEKEELIGDMLFNQYLVSTYESINSIITGRGQDLMIEAASEIGINNPRKIIGADSSLPELIARYSEVEYAYRISDFEAILSDEKGVSDLKDKYIAYIKNSDEYKNIFNAEGIDAIGKAINKGESKVYKGLLENFKDVKLPDAAEEYNSQTHDRLKQEERKYKRKILDIAYRYSPDFADEGAEYRAKDLSVPDLAKTASDLNNLYELLDDNNTWGGSKNNNYKNTMNKLKSIRDIARENAKIGKPLNQDDAQLFEKTLEEADALAVIYLENKTDINSDYAKRRVAAMKEVRQALRPMIASINPAIKKMKDNFAENYLGDVAEIIVNNNCDNYRVHPFYGASWKTPESRQIGVGKKPYSLAEGVGISASILALAMTGKYSVEDLLNHSKLGDEKHQEFKKIAEAMKIQSPEDDKYIAEVFYKGGKAIKKMISDLVKDVDFNKKDFFKNKNVIMASMLGNYLMDVENNIKYCKDDYVSLAKNDNPNIKNFEDIKTFYSPIVDVLPLMEELKENIAQLSTQNNNLDTYAGNVMGKRIKLLKIADAVENKKKENPDKKFDELFNAEEKTEFLKYNNASIEKSLKNNFNFLKDSPKIANNIAEGIVTGTIGKGVNVTVDNEGNNVQTENFPTEEIINEAVKNGVILKKCDEAIYRLQNNKYKKADDNYMKDCAYAYCGQMYRYMGKVPMVDKAGNEISLDKYIKNQLKSSELKDFLRSKTNPKNCIHPRDVVKKVKNEELMLNVARENANKFLNAQNNKNAAKKATNKKSNKKTNLKTTEVKKQNIKPN
ncbi:MAG: hypothetical protein K6E10_06185 [Eubacterium sp.]|nr:hypothetical protein [Eubacterium sp.]